MGIFNLELEKILLSYIIKDSAFLSEIPQINEYDFSTSNKIIFQAIKVCLNNDSNGFSKFVLIERLNSLNVKIGGEIQPSSYIEALELLGDGMSKEAAFGIAKQLKGVTIRRKLNETGQKIIDLTKKDEGKKSVELVNEVNEVFSKQVNILSAGEGQEPKDLFGTAEENIEFEKGSGDEKDVRCPYNLQADMFSDYASGGLYIYCSRMGIAKSQLLMNIAIKCSIQDIHDEFSCLILDCELEIERVQRRMVSSLSGVSEWFLKNRTYKNNQDMYDRVKKAWQQIKPWFGKIKHFYIGGLSLAEQISICRRWYQANIVGKKKKGMIILDYFKLGSVDDLSGSLKDYQVLGVKTDSYKQLATSLQLPVLAAVQAGRGNEKGQMGAKVENSSIVAGSDEIARFCTNMYLIQRLTIDEQALYNNFDVNLSLKPLKTRELGPNLQNQYGLVKYQTLEGQTKYSENFLLYSAKNFLIEEVCSFKDAMNKRNINNIDINNNVRKDNLF